MEKFEKLTAVAAPMPASNIDTDIIMPKHLFCTSLNIEMPGFLSQVRTSAAALRENTQYGG